MIRWLSGRTRQRLKGLDSMRLLLHMRVEAALCRAYVVEIAWPACFIGAGAGAYTMLGWWISCGLSSLLLITLRLLVALRRLSPLFGHPASICGRAPFGNRLRLSLRRLVSGTVVPTFACAMSFRLDSPFRRIPAPWRSEEHTS